jgi:dynein heavy chain
LDILLGFKAEVDEEKIPAKNFDAIRNVLADERFTPEIIIKASPAAAGLCDWIVNITAYYDVVVSVEPKKLAVAEAQATLAAANEKKATVDALVAKLNAELKELMDEFQAAMDDKNNAMAEAEKCERKLNLAQRLVGALGSEQERWSQSIIDLGEYL